jgi:hypothetical protein
MLWHKIQGAGGTGGLNMGDFMNSTLYTGDGTTARAITTGIDLSTGEGMIWVNIRSSNSSKPITDTNMGATNYLLTDTNNAVRSEAQALQSFDSSGFTVGSLDEYNNNTRSVVAWTFKSEPGVFDCLEYEGTGAAQTIAHSLGEVPGAIIIKNKDDSGGADDWILYHRGLNGGVNPEDYFLQLAPSSSAETNDTSIWNSTAPTASVFSLAGTGPSNEVNEAGDTYSTYIFPHNDNVQCGAYTGNGSTTGPTVTLGFEPQWLFIKNVDGAAAGLVWDNARNTSNPRTNACRSFEDLRELTSGYDVDFTATGFQPKTNSGSVNANAQSYVYIAIRKAD